MVVDLFMSLRADIQPAAIVREAGLIDADLRRPE
jgi:hypothetical protein